MSGISKRGNARRKFGAQTSPAARHTHCFPAPRVNRLRWSIQALSAVRVFVTTQAGDISTRPQSPGPVTGALRVRDQRRFFSRIARARAPALFPPFLLLAASYARALFRTTLWSAAALLHPGFTTCIRPRDCSISSARAARPTCMRGPPAHTIWKKRGDPTLSEECGCVRDPTARRPRAGRPPPRVRRPRMEGVR